jgi:hypothetical protein
MSAEPATRLDAAITEIETLILSHYPEATFEIALGDDPEGTYLTATVDIEDTDEVVDIIVERLLEMQVEEGIPLYPIIVRPIERVLAELRAPKPSWSRPLLPIRRST